MELLFGNACPPLRVFTWRMIFESSENSNSSQIFLSEGLIKRIHIVQKKKNSASVKKKTRRHHVDIWQSYWDYIQSESGKKLA